MMNLQRREEIRIIAECPNDMHWAQEMRRAVAELLAHIDTLEQTAEERVVTDGSRGPGVVPAVVVPEPTSDEWRAIAENAGRADMVDFLAGAAAYGLWLREHSRAIPSDRALGEGMVAVDRKALDAFAEKAAFIRRYPNTPPEYFRLEAIFKGGAPEVLALIDALRSNQGGADHD